MKAGVRGLSILFASGDFGTGCNSSSLPAKFAPEWPPTSPYVTAVGGTTFNAAAATRTDAQHAIATATAAATAAATAYVPAETAWTKSGGGFAYCHTRPSYQSAAVATYLTQQKGMSCK